MRPKFDEAGRRPDAARPIKKIAVISTQRSGSTFFCELLSRNGNLPRFEEWYNKDIIGDFADHRGIQRVNLVFYTDWLFRKMATNGVFVAKIHVNHLMEMEEVGFNPFRFGFDHVVGLSRRDKLAQALSLAKAHQTRQWTSELPSARPDLNASHISNEQLLQSLTRLSQWDAYYERKCASRVVCSYDYEDITSRPHIIRDVLLGMGIDPPGELTYSTPIRKQSDDIDAARIAAFRRYLGV